ncbi:MAG: purine-nucleoside phosphorylase [Actinobacteria bacterium]|nr:purine-nucleoside phosphorylase [Actinomycetota bacterium]
MTTDAAEALGRVAAWRPHAAAVYGSGLWALPEGARVEDEVPYDALGWPAGAVAGHHYVLRLAAVPAAGGRELRLALACGRPHRYEGWTDAELERPVRDLAATGVRRIVLTNSCGALRPEATVGRAVVCSTVVDLQRPPEDEEPERLRVCGVEEAERVAAALGDRSLPGAGVYVSVAGPQFETPAEVTWLAGYGDVVGMSAAPEARAAAAAGVECCLLALVANVAGAAGSHEDVLAAGARLGRLLVAGLPRALAARWPDLPDGA